MEFYSLKLDKTPLIHLFIFALYFFSHFHILWICQRLSRNFWIPWKFKFLQTFYKTDKFVIGPFETRSWIQNLYFFENKQEIRKNALSNFHPRFKNVDYMENLKFSLWVENLYRLKFQLNWVEISNRYAELRYLHVTAMSSWRGVYCLKLGWKSLYNQPLRRHSPKLLYIFMISRVQSSSATAK